MEISQNFVAFSEHMNCKGMSNYAPQYLQLQQGGSPKLKRKKPPQFFISTEVLHLQELPLQLKQTVRVTVSPTVWGCAPLSQPGAWVPQ